MKSILSRGAIAIATKGKNEFSDYYSRKLKEGKAKLSIINVIKNKMVSRVYAAVKRGTPYEKNYEYGIN
jgi:transposase